MERSIFDRTGPSEKRGPFRKADRLWLGRTEAFSLRPKFPEILVEWIVPALLSLRFDTDLTPFCVNQAVLMLTSLNLHEKSREVCIKARSAAASLAFIGQVTKHTTVK